MKREIFESLIQPLLEKVLDDLKFAHIESSTDDPPDFKITVGKYYTTTIALVDDKITVRTFGYYDQRDDRREFDLCDPDCMSRVEEHVLATINKIKDVLEEHKCKNEQSVALWQILDNIDTLSDMIKPNDLAGYKKFYQRALAFCEERHEILFADGYTLFNK